MLCDLYDFGPEHLEHLRGGVELWWFEGAAFRGTTINLYLKAGAAFSCFHLLYGESRVCSFHGKSQPPSESIEKF